MSKKKQRRTDNAIAKRKTNDKKIKSDLQNTTQRKTSNHNASNTGGELGCSGKVNSSSFINGTHPCYSHHKPDDKS